MDPTVPAVVALLALASAVSCLAVLHRLAPDVVPSRDAVSDYGAGPHAAWYRAQVVLLGSSAAAVAVSLKLADLEAGGVIWLYVFAVARVAIAGFPVDLPGTGRTRVGAMHNVLATTAFASIAVAASTIGPDLDRDPDWGLGGSWYRWSGRVVLGAAVALAIAWVTPTIRRSVFGLVERCWYAATIIWLGLTALGVSVI